MGRLILHIGTTKTGSTAVQMFLLNNREKLATHGFFYPVFTPQPGPTRVRNGAFVEQWCYARTSGQDPHSLVNDLEENKERLEKALSSQDRVLLTDEDFSASPGRLVDIGCSPELYWATVAQTLFEAGAQDISIVVYLRRQDDWVASWWRHTVRGGRTTQSLEEFCNIPGIRFSMDYAGMLETLKAAFGENANIIVRRYDKDAFEGGDIQHDFCAAVGIPWSDDYETIKKLVNISSTFDVTEALKPFVDVAPPRSRIREKALLPFALETSKKHPDPLGTTPIDEEATRLLMEPFLAGNELIASKYLDGKPLFSNEYGGRPVWTPNKERIAEYRAAFERVVRNYMFQMRVKDAVKSFARTLPEPVKRPLRAIKKRLCP